MYVVKREESPRYYAGYVGGLDGGPVWHQKKSLWTKLDPAIAELAVKQLTSLGFKVDKRLVFG